MKKPSQPSNFFQLLGDPARWQILTALVHSDLRVQELVDRLGRPQNDVSYHLRQLQTQGLVREQRSRADRRAVYYCLDLDQVKAGMRAAGAALHPALVTPSQPAPASPAPGERWRVLFLCTHNSARSQMAEGLLRARAHSQVDAFSAGTQPSVVHPLAIQVMAEMNIDIRSQRSKHLDEYLGLPFDYVITVCDLARESCPLFPGNPQQQHWSIPDPASVAGEPATRLAAFRAAAQELDRRIGYFLYLLPGHTTPSAE
jgi:protein-tyrosine-phosphatase/DNA-binding transcriptional ArsR family regulator